MAKLFDPKEFDPHARAIVAAKMEEARRLAHRAAIEFSEARQILEKGAGDEGIAFPFFQAELSMIAELEEDCVSYFRSWYPWAES